MTVITLLQINADFRGCPNSILNTYFYVNFYISVWFQTMKTSRSSDTENRSFCLFSSKIFERRNGRCLFRGDIGASRPRMVALSTIKILRRNTMNNKKVNTVVSLILSAIFLTGAVLLAVLFL